MASLTGSTIASSYKDLLQVSNSNSGIDGTARVVSDGEDTASKLFLDTNRVGVGIAPTEGTFHVHTATADGGGETATADGAADDLVVENSGAGGITILTPNNALGQLAFGSPADAYGAFIGWKADDNQMTIATANAGDSIVMQTANKVTALTIDSSQHVGIGVIPDGILFRAEKSVDGNWAGLIGNTHATNGSGLKVQAGDDANVDSFRVSSVGNTTLFNINGAGTANFSGNVGIGGTPSRRLESINTNAGADTLLLQLRNNSSNTSTSSSLRFVNSTSGTSSAGGAEISAIRNANDGGSLTIKTAQDSSATLTTALTIDSGQKIGIGTASPTALLHVQQASGSDTDFTNSNNPEAHHGILLNNNRFEAGSFTAITMNTANASSVNGVSIISQSASSGHAGKMIFARRALSGTTESMRIDEDGNIGIGLTDPNSTCMVGGSTSSGGDIAIANTNTTISNGHSLGGLYFKGKDDGSSGAYGIGAKIVADCTQDWNEGTNEGTELKFWVTNNNQSSNINAMTIGQSGEVFIGSDAQGVSFHGVNSGEANITAINRNVSGYKKLVLNASEHSIKIEGSEKVAINSSGHVSINDTSTTKQLNVLDTDNAAGRFTRSTASATTGHLSDALVVRGKTGGDMADGFGAMIAFEINDSANTDNSIGGCGMMRDGADNSGKFFIANNNAGTYAANFYVDKTGNVGIGTASPSKELHIAKSGEAQMIIDSHIANNNGSSIRLRHSRNATIGNLTTAVNDNDQVGDITFQGSDGSSYESVASIRAIVDGSVSDGSIGGSLVFKTGTVNNTGLILDDNSRISLSNNDAGTSNTIFGKNAGLSLDDGSNYNVFVGEAVSDASMSDASSNTAIGYAALSALTTGDGNVAIGKDSAAGLTTGGHGVDGNVIIGATADCASGSTNRVAIGYGCTAVGDNSVTLGNGNVTAVYMASDSGATIYASNGVFIADEPFITVRDSSSYSAGTGGGISYQGFDSSGNVKQFATTQGYSIGDNNGGLAIYTRDGGSNNLAVIVDNNRAVKPGADSAYDLGTSSLTWRTLYAENIKFPGTQVASADANTLDDYEEGDHTATVVGSTSGNYVVNSTNDILRYTKIGRLVNIQGLILIDSDNSASGQLRISLPFTIGDGTGLGGRSYGSAYLTAHGGTIAGRVYAKLEEGNAFFTLVEVADNGTDNDISDSDVDGAFNIGVNFSYTV